jgi:hypothetical protein
MSRKAKNRIPKTRIPKTRVPKTKNPKGFADMDPSKKENRY